MFNTNFIEVIIWSKNERNGGFSVGKSIVFDMDGTLFQTNLILEPALNHKFESLRAKGLWIGNTPIEKYQQIMGAPLPVVWEALCPNHTQQIRRESNEVFQQKLKELISLKKGALYSNVQTTLKQLSQKYTLFIASNGQSDYLQAIVDTYGFNRYIKKVYSIESVSSGNKSELVEKIIKENLISQGMVVGDRLSDIKAAKDNGLAAIGVKFDFAQDRELEEADYVIHHFEELLKLSNYLK